MHDSPYHSRIVLTQHLQDHSAYLLVHFPIFLDELVEGAFEGVPAPCEFRTTGGALVLLLFDYVSGGAGGAEAVLNRGSVTVQGRTVVAFYAKQMQHYRSYSGAEEGVGVSLAVWGQGYFQAFLDDAAFLPICKVAPDPGPLSPLLPNQACPRLSISANRVGCSEATPYRIAGRVVILVAVRCGGGGVREVFFGLEGELFGLRVGEGLGTRGGWFGGLQYTHQIQAYNKGTGIAEMGRGGRKNDEKDKADREGVISS